MDQESLKTSPKQRIFIGAIAAVMLITIVMSYVMIVLGGGTSTTPSSLSPEVIAKYEAAYAEAVADFKTSTQDYFNDFINYRSNIVAYNAANANAGGLVTRDLKIGSGRTLTDGDKNYLAFYVGWCANGDVFDSSFDSESTPSAFASALDASNGLIEGWENGVVGMNLGGIRELTIPGELAYANAREICGGYNSPLKFIVMALENSGALAEKAAAVNLANVKLYYANNGIDYDEYFSANSTKASGE